MDKEKGHNYEEIKKKFPSPTETEIMRVIEDVLEDEEAWVKYVKQFGEPVEGFLPLLFDKNGHLKVSKEDAEKIMKMIEQGKESNLNSGL